jgi:hypothetical protein
MSRGLPLNRDELLEVVRRVRRRDPESILSAIYKALHDSWNPFEDDPTFFDVLDLLEAGRWAE